MTNPIEMMKIVGTNISAGINSTIGSFFEVKEQAEGAAKRTNFNDSFPIDRLFLWGTCIPGISQSVGVARAFYGVVLLNYGLCELVNKWAVAHFSEKTPVMDKISLLKGGVAPVLLRGLEHIVLGITAQASIIGTISCIAYETILRPYVAPKAAVSVDGDCFNKLYARIQKHSAVQKINKNISELSKLVFTA
jgi:hypothetical protein